MEGKTCWWPIPVNCLVRELKPTTVNGVPEDLVHIAKVEGCCLKDIIAQHCLIAQFQGVCSYGK